MAAMSGGFFPWQMGRKWSVETFRVYKAQLLGPGEVDVDKSSSLVKDSSFLSADHGSVYGLV
jgi:hypothetical protein